MTWSHVTKVKIKMRLDSIEWFKCEGQVGGFEARDHM
jgi:hypothetical protein